MALRTCGQGNLRLAATQARTRWMSEYPRFAGERFMRRGWKRLGRYWMFGTGSLVVYRNFPRRGHKGWIWSQQGEKPYKIVDLANVLRSGNGGDVLFDTLAEAMDYVQRGHVDGDRRRQESLELGDDEAIQP